MRSMKWGGVLAVAAWACGAPRTTADAAASPPPVAIGAPLSFAPDAGIPPWRVEAPPEGSHPTAPVVTDADRAEFALVAQGCTTDAMSAVKLCPAQPNPRRAACIQVCLDALEAAIFARSAVPPMAPPPLPVSGPPPSPAHVPDSFEHALRACIADVVESGGEAPATCHFNRPLDEMDFGQKHCDERCARATGKPRPR